MGRPPEGKEYLPLSDVTRIGGYTGRVADDGVQFLYFHGYLKRSLTIIHNEAL
jgi:hypothetical protein